ncbi:MAG: diguanylate cyclase [Cyanobacteria bacterium M_surface_10_m2_119]|jgi:diguanylate cyclase (GGDEF)-like protein|nr:diguanylate cyclase [Cyanobacteria bacterium M_surface_10_m2_119]
MSGSTPHGLDDNLEERVAELLADEQYADHPLREVLEQVMDRMGQQLSRLERITQISDRYQTGAQERVLHISRRYDRQIRKLEKAIRISDRYQAMLNDLNKALQEASTHDQLTGLPNRRLMADRCRREDHRSQRESSTYSLLAIDVDRFKTINDTYGHEAGDRVLVELGQAFRRGLRDYDSCARWGGEEFLALLIGADLSTAEHVAQRILETVRSLCVDLPSGVISPRVSIGVAEHHTGELYTDVYRRADAALLLAKESGRDRFLVAAPPTELEIQTAAQLRDDPPSA